MVILCCTLICCAVHLLPHNTRPAVSLIIYRRFFNYTCIILLFVKKYYYNSLPNIDPGGLQRNGTSRTSGTFRTPHCARSTKVVVCSHWTPTGAGLIHEGLPRRLALFQVLFSVKVLLYVLVPVHKLLPGHAGQIKKPALLLFL